MTHPSHFLPDANCVGAIDQVKMDDVSPIPPIVQKHSDTSSAISRLTAAVTKNHVRVLFLTCWIWIIDHLAFKTAKRQLATTPTAFSKLVYW